MPVCCHYFAPNFQNSHQPKWYQDAEGSVRATARMPSGDLKTQGWDTGLTSSTNEVFAGLGQGGIYR